MIDWTNWSVAIDFELDGIRGREIALVEAEHASMAMWRAWGDLERTLIYERLVDAHECGCCAAGNRFKWLGSTQEKIPTSNKMSD